MLAGGSLRRRQRNAGAIVEGSSRGKRPAAVAASVLSEERSRARKALRSRPRKSQATRRREPPPPGPAGASSKGGRRARYRARAAPARYRRCSRGRWRPPRARPTRAAANARCEPSLQSSRQVERSVRRQRREGEDADQHRVPVQHARIPPEPERGEERHREEARFVDRHAAENVAQSGAEHDRHHGAGKAEHGVQKLRQSAFSRCERSSMESPAGRGARAPSSEAGRSPRTDGVPRAEREDQDARRDSARPRFRPRPGRWRRAPRAARGPCGPRTGAGCRRRSRTRPGPRRRTA